MRMRCLTALPLLACGCQATIPVAPVVVAAAVDASTVAVFGRGTLDMAYSAVSGRDCSIVRLDRGESYCKPKETPPAPPPFCTRTLGQPECFATPQFLPDRPAQLADTPALTAAQTADMKTRWGF